MRNVLAMSFALAIGAASGGAQATRGVIDPGMSKDQVVERLGQPAGERTAGAFTYLYYANGCERKCGTPDLVTLEANVVIDAIIRSPARRYTGASSSPKGATPSPSGAEATPGTEPAARPPAGGTISAPPPSQSRRAEVVSPAPQRTQRAGGDSAAAPPAAPGDTVRGDTAKLNAQGTDTVRKRQAGPMKAAPPPGPRSPTPQTKRPPEA